MGKPKTRQHQVYTTPSGQNYDNSISTQNTNLRKDYKYKPDLKMY